jgi:anti-sigma factor RsiW
MTCDECFEAVSASVDGELASDQQEEVNEHLDGCGDCRRLRARLLSLSAEMKGQPFPEALPERVTALVQAALDGQQASSGWTTFFWRRFLRAPSELWLYRHGLRLTAFGGVTALAVLSIVTRWLLPSYAGLEAAANNGLPNSAAWLAWAPSTLALSWAPLVVLLVAAWTGGLPALLSDLAGEVRLTHLQVATTAAGLALAGPFAALPLLAELEFSAYALVCCFWTGLCMVAAFTLIAFKTRRPLPRLALDFVALVVPLGLLEWLARASVGLPRAVDCQPTLALLVGSVPFSALTTCLALLGLAATALGVGVAGMVPSYRAVGGRWPSLMMLLGGLACLGFSLSRVQPDEAVSPLRAEMKLGRRAYLLASGPANPWLLTAVDYPALEVAVAGPGKDPRAARLGLAAAILDWDEERTLKALQSWADNAPGVTWGLSALVDSLGERQGRTLTLPSEDRQRLVQHLLNRLRWRMPDQQIELAQDTGSVSGRIEGVEGQREGLRLRLIEVQDDLDQVSQLLEKEASWATGLVARDDLDPNFSVSMQRTTTTGVDGEFEFRRVRDGRYVLALLAEPSSLIHNATIPGTFEVKDGQKVSLPPIRLAVGNVGQDLSLESGRWQVQGPAEFSVTSAGPVVALEQGSAISSIVEGQLFSSGTARIKLLTTGGAGLLQVTLLSKEGRLLKQSQSEIRQSGGLTEIEISSGQRQGYLQISISAVGRLTVVGLKLEVLR